MSKVSKVHLSQIYGKKELKKKTKRGKTKRRSMMSAGKSTGWKRKKCKNNELKEKKGEKEDEVEEKGR